jgi:hypothetical protein
MCMFVKHFFQMYYMSFMLSIVVVWNSIFYNDGQFKMYNVMGLYFAIFMFLYHENFVLTLKPINTTISLVGLSSYF